MGLHVYREGLPVFTTHSHKYTPGTVFRNLRFLSPVYTSGSHQYSGNALTNQYLNQTVIVSSEMMTDGAWE